jgi:hypothetical protein
MSYCFTLSFDDYVASLSLLLCLYHTCTFLWSFPKFFLPVLRGTWFIDYTVLCFIRFLYRDMCYPSQSAIMICHIMCQTLMTYIGLSLVHHWRCQSVQFGSLSESSVTETVAAGLLACWITCIHCFHREHWLSSPCIMFLCVGNVFGISCMLIVFSFILWGGFVHGIVCMRARPLETERVWSKIRMIVSMVHHSLSIRPHLVISSYT